MRIVILKLAENENPNKQSEAAKHLKYFSDHQFEWKVPNRVSEYTRKIKILEVFLIKLSIRLIMSSYSQNY